MTLIEFGRTVLEMREAQREYFATKSRSALSKSKKCEEKVDRKLEELRRLTPVQTSLFENAGGGVKTK